MGPNDLHPSPLPNFKCYKLFLICFLKLPNFSTVQSCAPNVAFFLLHRYNNNSKFHISRNKFRHKFGHFCLIIHFVLETIENPICLFFHKVRVHRFFSGTLFKPGSTCNFFCNKFDFDIPKQCSKYKQECPKKKSSNTTQVGVKTCSTMKSFWLYCSKYGKIQRLLWE
jgi:hypothetical protein